VVGGLRSLETWTRTTGSRRGLTVLLPNELGHRSKYVRVLADELAFATQNIVIVPDIFYEANSECKISCFDEAQREAMIDDYLSQSYQNASAQEKSTFQSVISTLMYATTAYNCGNSITIAGVGIGGGLAINVTAALNDDARTRGEHFSFKMGAINETHKQPASQGEFSTTKSVDSPTLSGSKASVGSTDENMQFSLSSNQCDISELLQDVRSSLWSGPYNISGVLKQSQMKQLADIGELLNFDLSDGNTPELSRQYLRNVGSLELNEIAPRAVLAFCPTRFSMKQSLQKLKSPLCLIYGERQLIGPRRYP
jgi:hypothetical protein